MKSIISSKVWFSFLSIYIYITLSCAAQVKTVPEPFSNIKTVIMLDSDGPKTLPSLPDFNARIDFPPRDIKSAAMLTAGDRTACYIWSSKNYSWTKFNSDGLALTQPFANANRVYCTDSQDVGGVMIEDRYRNEQFVRVEYEKSTNRFDGETLYKGTLKLPLTVRRAIPLGTTRECIFRSRTSFSASYTSERTGSEPWPEPFKGAVEVYCIKPNFV